MWAAGGADMGAWWDTTQHGLRGWWDTTQLDLGGWWDTTQLDAGKKQEEADMGFGG